MKDASLAARWEIQTRENCVICADQHTRLKRPKRFFFFPSPVLSYMLLYRHVIHSNRANPLAVNLRSQNVLLVAPALASNLARLPTPHPRCIQE